MQNLTQQFKDEANKSQNRPIELCDIYLGSQVSTDSQTYYFCTNNAKITFWNLDGIQKEYLPLGLKRSSIPASNQLEIETVGSEFDNVDRAFSNWLATKDLRGKRVVIRKVFLDLLTDATHAKILFDGIINAVSELTELSVKIECKSKLKSLSVETGRMQQLYCNWIFGDTECGYNINSTKVTGQTVDSGTTTEIIDAARTEADDYWNDGVIEFTSGANDGEKRKVVDFILAQNKLILDYALPNIPQAGDTYNLERGCDKSLTVCTNRFGNQANFGAFPSIPMLINPQIEKE